MNQHTTIRNQIEISQEDAVLYDEYIEKSKQYDRLQYVYKIKLNSLYGATSNQFFRFYDPRLSESTTRSGRTILRHQCAEVCSSLDGKYLIPIINDDSEGYSQESSVLYSDTDSVYFKTWSKNRQQAVMVADSVAQKVNESFPVFMRDTFLCGPEYEGRIMCERELVSDRGIFVDKKRYILHLVDLGGYKVDKLKVMGLDTKKTTLPKLIANKLNGFIEDLLKGKKWDDIAQEIIEYKDEVETTNDIMSIGLPKGIRGVEEYTIAYNRDMTTRLPGHVAASICWNLLLKEHGDQESPPITTGMKIKVFYLTNAPGRFKSIAIPTDIEVVPQWFLNIYNVDRKAHVERLVNNPLKNILKAIGTDIPTKQTKLIDSLLVF